MSKITVLPHASLCPEGRTFDADPSASLCDNLLRHGIDIEHACEKVCACTTCHVIVRAGFDALDEAEEKEEDMLDKAWGLEPTSRLSCQTRLPGEDITIEIPKYTINMVSEGK
jgi:2Fe-2S ferredoxin